VFFVGDESDAVVAPTKAGVLGPVLEVEAVVVGEFFAFGDFSERVNPHFAADDVGLTVGITGVIDQPCGIPCHGTVDVGALIQLENIDRCAACLFRLFDESVGPALGLGLRDALTDVLDDPGVIGDVLPSEDPFVMNVGAADDVPGCFFRFGHGEDSLGSESPDVVPEAWASQTCLGLSIKKGERPTALTLG